MCLPSGLYKCVTTNLLVVLFLCVFQLFGFASSLGSLRWMVVLPSLSALRVKSIRLSARRVKFIWWNLRLCRTLSSESLSLLMTVSLVLCWQVNGRPSGWKAAQSAFGLGCAKLTGSVLVTAHGPGPTVIRPAPSRLHRRYHWTSTVPRHRGSPPWKSLGRESETVLYLSLSSVGVSLSLAAFLAP